MASILDKFGIKEVGDVTFYHLNTNGQPDYPVLFLDTCKTTSLEQTADEVEAKGGKGNVSLMVWDTNKQLTVNLEDALFSAKSMAIMFGNGTAAEYSTGSTTGENGKYIMKTETFTAKASSVFPTRGSTSSLSNLTVGWDQGFTAPDGKRYVKLNPKFYSASGEVVTGATPEAGKWPAFSAEATYKKGDLVSHTESNVTKYYIAKADITTAGSWDATKWDENCTLIPGNVYFCSYDLAVAGSVITIDKDSFPGSYYVTMDTYARMQGSGEDDFFQLIMPNCKVQSSNTITMSADGDPSTLTMNLKVQKPVSGPMVYMVKYGLTDKGPDAAAAAISIAHNHVMNGDNPQG